MIELTPDSYGATIDLGDIQTETYHRIRVGLRGAEVTLTFQGGYSVPTATTFNTSDLASVLELLAAVQAHLESAND